MTVWRNCCSQILETPYIHEKKRKIVIIKRAGYFKLFLFPFSKIAAIQIKKNISYKNIPTHWCVCVCVYRYSTASMANSWLYCKIMARRLSRSQIEQILTQPINDSALVFVCIWDPIPPFKCWNGHLLLFFLLNFVTTNPYCVFILHTTRF